MEENKETTEKKEVIEEENKEDEKEPENTEVDKTIIQDKSAEIKLADRELEKRKQKAKTWFKNPYHILLIILLIFALCLYLYYFNITKTQTLWHDEAEYMSMAKFWIFDIPYEINPARPVLFPFLISFFLVIGLGELSIRFFLELIPLLISIVIMYLLVLEMYNNKKLALIASLILSVSWIHIFYAMRIMTDSTGFLFGLLAFFCFWKGYTNKKGKVYIWLIGPFVGLAFLSRLTGILFGVSILVFLLLTDKFAFLKNKHIWISLVLTFLPIIPYLMWSQSTFGNPFAFRAGYTGAADSPLGWWMLQLLIDYPEKVFFVFFLIGLITLLPMILSLDTLILKKNRKYSADFFLALTILFTLGFFIYFLRAGENRWLIMMSIGIFIFAGKGILLISDYLSKNINKVLAIAFVALVIIFGAYYQLNHADDIIKSKVHTYDQVKEAALWMKEHSELTDLIVSASFPQTTYYAEREVMTFYNFTAREYFTPETFDKIIESRKPKYLAVSIFEPSNPQWTYVYPEKNQSKYIPVQALFGDNKEQPILIIYEINY